MAKKNKIEYVVEELSFWGWDYLVGFSTAKDAHNAIDILKKIPANKGVKYRIRLWSVKD